MGRSKRHASSVALCLNLETGYISSQFHVVFDDHFHTVTSPNSDNDPKLQHLWQQLLQNNREWSLDDDYG